MKRLNKYWEAIVSLMDDEIRERVHFELAPCTNAEFLRRYLELAPDFADLLWGEFGIHADDLEEAA